MTTVLKTVLVALTGAFVFSAPASAQGWWDASIAASKAQSGGEVSERRAPRATRVSAPKADVAEVASKPKRATRVASVNNEDDGSRPQRKSAPKSESKSESLSGGETGIASYYWQPQRLAGGGWFNPDAYTAAHKTLPLGTRVRVTRADNGSSVDVLINDRGPYVAGRVIDLSRRAAQSIGMTGQGLTRVRVNVIGRG
jgi:rare lipoprotein A (peptidoglycan hydrolase)